MPFKRIEPMEWIQAGFDEEQRLQSWNNICQNNLHLLAQGRFTVTVKLTFSGFFSRKYFIQGYRGRQTRQRCTVFLFMEPYLHSQERAKILKKGSVFPSLSLSSAHFFYFIERSASAFCLQRRRKPWNVLRFLRKFSDSCWQQIYLSELDFPIA